MVISYFNLPRSSNAFTSFYNKKRNPLLTVSPVASRGFAVESWASWRSNSLFSRAKIQRKVVQPIMVMPNMAVTMP